MNVFVRQIPMFVAAACMTSIALAQVPPQVEARLKEIGPIVDPACTAELYRPLMPADDITSGKAQPYPGITVARNQSFGSDALDVVDVFASDKGSAARTVFIFVPGGAGNKIEIQAKATNAFYDNIGRWAANHDMVGVIMQRKANTSWDGGAKDVSAMLQWVQAHIRQYHGNPDRVFAMAHSAGNYPLGTYAGRSELYSPKGVGLKGIIFMSPASFDIAPAKLKRPEITPDERRAMGERVGRACGKTGGIQSTEGALPGVAPGNPGAAPLRSAPPPSMQGDAATLLARSSLPELKRTAARIMLINAAMDPKANDGMEPFVETLNEALCAAGPQRCPKVLVAKGHSHMSEVFSFDTEDKSVSGAVLNFIEETP